MRIFGYTIVNDVSSRDPWLDGDQWLLGKSMAGFCPVGPWIVTADELDPADLRLGCTDQRRRRSRTARPTQLRFGIAEIVAFLSRHVDAPARRPDRDRDAGPPRRPASAPTDHLRPGDVVTCWIEGIGELTHDDRLTRRRRPPMKPPTVFLGEMTSPEVEAFLARHHDR